MPPTTSSQQRRRLRIMEESDDDSDGSNSSVSDASREGMLASKKAAAKSARKLASSTLSASKENNGSVQKSSFRLSHRSFGSKKPSKPTKTSRASTKRKPTIDSDDSSSSSSGVSDVEPVRKTSTARGAAHRKKPLSVVAKRKSDHWTTKLGGMDSDSDSSSSDSEEDEETERPPRRQKPLQFAKKSDKKSESKATLTIEIDSSSSSDEYSESPKVNTMKVTPKIMGNLTNNRQGIREVAPQPKNEILSIPPPKQPPKQSTTSSRFQLTRNPPKQPIRRQGPPKVKDDGLSSSSSDESEMLRHVARKCATTKTPSPLPMSSGSNYQKSASKVLEVSEECSLPDHLKRRLIGHSNDRLANQDRDKADANHDFGLIYDSDDENTHRQPKENTLGAAHNHQNCDEVSGGMTFHGNDQSVSSQLAQKRATDNRLMDDGDNHDDDDDDGNVNGNNDDAASEDTEELTKRLSARYGKNDTTAGANDNRSAVGNAEKQQPAEQGEFVLPYCDSSSSSSSGSSSADNNATTNQAGPPLKCPASIPKTITTQQNHAPSRPINPYTKSRKSTTTSTSGPSGRLNETLLEKDHEKENYYLVGDEYCPDINDDPAWDEHNDKSAEELEESLFLDHGNHRVATAPTFSNRGQSDNVVDLCDDEDDDEARHQPLNHQTLYGAPTALPRTTVRQGTRTPNKSPFFNSRSRNFCHSGGVPTWQPTVSVHAASSAMNAASKEDIEYYSDDGATPHARSRRVTTSTSMHRSHDNGFGGASLMSSGPSVAAKPPPSFSSSVPSQWNSEPKAKRRRIRNAANNPSNARCIGSTRQAVQDQRTIQPPSNVSGYGGPLVQSNTDGVWFRQQTQPQQGWPMRNDLAGGSGVGAGQYRFYSQVEEEDIDYDEDDGFESAPRRPAGRGRGRGRGRGGRTQRSSSKRKAKGGWGGRKRGRFAKKGGGSSRRGGRGGGGRGSWSNQQGSVMQSRPDSVLGNLGGADIQF